MEKEDDAKEEGISFQRLFFDQNLDALAPKVQIKGVALNKLNPLGPSSSSAPLIQGSIKKEAAISTHTSIHGLSEEKEKRVRDLYDRLDTDNDGTININDLSRALKTELPHIPPGLAPVCSFGCTIFKRIFYYFSKFFKASAKTIATKSISPNLLST